MATGQLARHGRVVDEPSLGRGLDRLVVEVGRVRQPPLDPRDLGLDQDVQVAKVCRAALRPTREPALVVGDPGQPLRALGRGPRLAESRQAERAVRQVVGRGDVPRHRLHELASRLRVAVRRHVVAEDERRMEPADPVEAHSDGTPSAARRKAFSSKPGSANWFGRR